VPRGFPAPDLVLTAVMRTGTAAVQQVAVVHGTGAGLEGGRRAGASVMAGVLTGPHGAARLRASGATYILPSIAEFPDLVLAERPFLSPAGMPAAGMPEAGMPEAGMPAAGPSETAGPALKSHTPRPAARSSSTTSASLPRI
jgi:hypothetical protein